MPESRSYCGHRDVVSLIVPATVAPDEHVGGEPTEFERLAAMAAGFGPPVAAHRDRAELTHLDVVDRTAFDDCLGKERRSSLQQRVSPTRLPVRTTARHVVLHGEALESLDLARLHRPPPRMHRVARAARDTRGAVVRAHHAVPRRTW